MNKRIGKFYISEELIPKLTPSEFELTKHVISQMTTVECYYHQSTKQFELIAISPLFDVVEEGCKINEYRVWITGDEIKFEKVVDG